MKKLFRFCLTFLLVFPTTIMFSACKNNDDGENTPPTTPPPAVVTLTSMKTEMINGGFDEEYNEATKTFTIEYGEPLPSVADFEVTANYSDGSTLAVEDIKVVCPVEFYESNMVVREQPYEFEIVKDNATADKIVEFFVKIVKKKVTMPTLVENQTFVYDGNVKNLEFVGFDDDVMQVSDGSKIDANSYVAMVELKDTDNYEWTEKGDVLTFDWVIEKAKLEPLSLVGTYVYNGTEQTVEIDYKTYSEDLFEVTNDKNTDANSYVAFIELINNNYEWNGVNGNTLRLDWVIEKAKLEPLSVVGTYVYNGSEQTAVIDYKNYDASLFELYNHKQTDANTYKVWVAIIGNNHEWIGDEDYVSEIDWIIERKEVATAELPSVVGEYVYSGESIKVNFDAKFNNAFMRIENGSAVEVGKHKVKIYLDSNHKFADASIEAVGYYELEWEIVEPEPEILFVDLSGYDITDWVGTYNTVVDDTTKIISLSGLPEQVDVAYSHTKDGEVADEDEFNSMGTYVTTAVITLKSGYLETYKLPAAEDASYIPTITNARYESIVIEEDKITISFTWKIYTDSRELEYTWNGESEYVYGESITLPVVELSSLSKAFSFEYSYYMYNETLEEYVKLSSIPTEIGKYKVSATVVTEMYFTTTTVIEDFEFEIV